ncbi:MAG: 50S ribosomal protein L31 [Endomicrobium sp.]|jgi:large subunit ribosomal protein L31|nr:50S ribosomal protein L31 [Endomicrobium sp.]
MNSKIHPKYLDSVVSCACGYIFKTRSTKPIIKLEICSNCHPFFTGKQKFVDATGMIEKFQKRIAKKQI